MMLLVTAMQYQSGLKKTSLVILFTCFIPENTHTHITIHTHILFDIPPLAYKTKNLFSF